MTTQILPTKGTLESVVIGFNFSREAASVLNPTIDVSVESAQAGNDTPAAILVDGPQIDETNPARVLQRVHAGVDATTYRLQCTVQTSTGDVLTLPVLLPVAAKL